MHTEDMENRVPLLAILAFGFFGGSSLAFTALLEGYSVFGAFVVYNLGAAIVIVLSAALFALRAK
jgi:hypothetical protein